MCVLREFIRKSLLGVILDKLPSEISPLSYSVWTNSEKGIIVSVLVVNIPYGDHSPDHIAGQAYIQPILLDKKLGLCSCYLVFNAL